MSKKILIDEDELLQLDASSTAIDSGPSSHIGKRNAYGALVQQQRSNFSGECHVTLFSLLTCYNIAKAKSEQKIQLLQPPLLIMDRNGVIESSVENNKFQIGDIVFTRMHKLCVVNLCPFVPLSYTDERSCYSTILVHTPWPIEGEESILGDCTSAVERLKILTESNLIPAYVKPALEMIQESRRISENQGIPRSNLDSDGGEHFDNNDDDELNNHYDGLFDENGELRILESDDIEEPPIRNVHADGVEVIANMSTKRKLYYQNFIKNTQERHMISFRSQHQVMAGDVKNLDRIDAKRIVAT
jgi:hypothetical protein